MIVMTAEEIQAAAHAQLQEQIRRNQESAARAQAAAEQARYQADCIRAERR
ncbi:hypothetical protein ACIGO8_08155 [Streptomyces sp. NPDC053493]|uniref:hypothetical protein n=1 Tax=Streptomyces sp. NPDC053493 TaxID=3365705 RepID=UPI0037CE20C9